MLIQLLNENRYSNSLSRKRERASSLSDLKNRSENSAERGQILPVLQVNSHSIDLQNRQNMDRSGGFAADSLQVQQAASPPKDGSQVAGYKPDKARAKNCDAVYV